MKKQETGKPAVSQVIKKAEENGHSMTYHMLLTWVEVFLVFRNIMNLASSFMSAVSWQRTVDQIFYVLLLMCAVLALIWRDRKKGTVSLFMYMIIDLLMTCVVYYFAVSGGLAISGLHEKMISMIIGLALWFVPTLIYYHKRWEYLI